MQKYKQPTLRLSLLSCAIALAAAGSSGTAAAVDLCTGNTTIGVAGAVAGTSCTLDTANAQLSVGSGGAIDQGVLATATGVKVGNAGSIGADTTALHFSGVALDGAVTNTGTIAGSVSNTSGYHYVGGLVADQTVSGSIGNSGTISSSTVLTGGNAQGTALYIGGDLTGKLTNGGTISGYSETHDWNYATAYGVDIGGNVVNGSTLSNSGTIKAEALSAGDGANAYALYVSGLLDTGFVNSGTVSAKATSHGSTANASAIYLGSGIGPNGGISNTGTISASANGLDRGYAYGVVMYNHPVATASGTVSAAMSGNAAITNTGHIDVSSSSYWNEAYGYGVILNGDMRDNAKIVNAASGVINVTANSGASTASVTGIKTGSLYGNASITNNGVISLNAQGGVGSGNDADIHGINTGSLNDNASITNTGTLSMTLWGGSDAYGYGIETGSLSGAAKIVNTGTISMTAHGDTSYAEAFGIYTGSLSNTASISNAGTISMTADAHGYAEAAGIETGSLNDAATLTNTGTISVKATSATEEASAWGIYVGGLYGVDNKLTNNGSISALADGHTYAYAYGIRNSGDMDGTLTITGAITAIAHGGRYEGSAYGILTTGGMYPTTSSFSNSATITATADADEYAYAYGVAQWGDMNGSLTNTGALNASATARTYEAYGYGLYIGGSMNPASSVLTNSGAISVTAHGREYAYAYGLDVSGSLNGAVSNSGPISATATADIYDATAYGLRGGSQGYATSSLTNTGAISAVATGGEYAYAYALDVGDIMGTLNTSAPITATAKASLYTAYASGITTGALISGALSNSGAINVSATGYEDAYAYGIDTYYLTGASSITNSNNITVMANAQTNGAYAYGISTYYLDGTSSISNSGRIFVEASAEKGGRATAYGIDSAWLSNTAAITNTGSIVAKASAVANSAYAYGISSSGSLNDSAVISNSGSVIVSAMAGRSQGYAYGLYESGSLNMTSSLQNSGTIIAMAEGQSSASAYGMRANGLNDSSSMTNSGTIQVSALNHVSSSAYAYGISANWMYGNSSISNSGNITVSAVNEGLTPSSNAYAYGILGYTDSAGASITNSGNVKVYAKAAQDAYAYAYGIYGYDNLGTITNTGTIEASIGSNKGSAWGIYVGGSGTGLINNSGRIVGGVYAATNSLTNSGSIVSGAQQNYIGGNYTQAAGGSYEFVLRNTSEYGNLRVNGTADFSASNTILVSMDPRAAFHNGDVLTGVVNANTLVPNAAGFNVIDKSLFWDFTTTNQAYGFDLTLKAVNPATVFAGAGVTLTSSQTALVNDLLTGNVPSGYGDLQAALNTATSASQAAHVLEAVGPAWAGGAAFATLVASTPANNAISARMGETRGAGSGDAFTKNAVWIKPFIGKATQDNANGVTGYDVKTAGFVIGMDGDVTDAARVGVAVASSKANGDGSTAKVDIDTTQFTLYGSYALSGSTSLDADLSYSANNYDSTRHVTFAGSNAVASYDGSLFALGAALSHRMAMSADSTFVPSLTLRYNHVDINSYSETGAGAYDLSVGGNTEDSYLAVAKAGYELKLTKGVFLANVGVGYDSSNKASATATLAGNGPTFVSNGIEPSSTLVTGGIGYRYVTVKNLEITAAYDLESRSDFLGQTASVKFRLPF